MARREKKGSFSTFLQRDGEEIEVEVRWTRTPGSPGCNYLPNGDPGDPPEPPETDIQVLDNNEEDITGTLTDSELESILIQTDEESSQDDGSDEAYEEWREREGWNSVAFWICVVGGVLDSFIALLCYHTPELSKQADSFVFCALFFVIGAVANYINIKQLESNKKW